MQQRESTSIELGRPPLTSRACAADGAVDGPAARADTATSAAARTSPAPAAPPASSGDVGAGRQPSDASWSTVFGSPTLPSGCRALAVDGPRVYLGGDFIYGMAGTSNDTYERVAMWDGSGWQPMGAGLNGTVNAIAVAGESVYVGGDFTVADGKVAAAHLARWNGTSWSAVPGSPTDPDRDYGTTVNALASDGQTLYVAGTFARAGNVPCRSLAVLDLTTGIWSEPGGGVSASYSTEPATVRALALRGSELFVGGFFDRAGEVEAGSFASWNPATASWNPHGAGVHDDDLAGFVYALAVDAASGAVYLGGRFTKAGDVGAWNLAVLEGETYRSLGDVSSYGGSTAEVKAIAVAGSGLYIGGSFTAAGNAAADHLARYDGTSWSPVGDGIDNEVAALAATPDGAVVVVGDFSMSGELRVPGGGVWTGTSWRTFGQGVNGDPFGNGTVSAIVPDAGGAFVGGLFDQAGHVRVGSVARWDGTAWDAMAGGVRADQTFGQVFAMTRIGADLYVAGSFQTAGGAAANNIARWDGTSWSPLGDGVDDTVYALTVLAGKLYVGGTFNVAGGVRANHLACWDPGTSTWAGVGNSPRYDDDIRALAAIDDRWLVVGGTFHRFFDGNTTVVQGLWGMVLFDTAAAPGNDLLNGYHALEGTSRYGAPGWVNVLQVLGGDLYVGGWFDVAGIMELGDTPSPGFPTNNLAVWHFATNGGWESVAGGTDAQVQAFAEADGALAVGGWFSRAGNTPAARVARYDPAGPSWHALGSGLGDGARGGSWAPALAHAAESGLWVGGQFPVAGAAPSDNLALWNAAGS